MKRVIDGEQLKLMIKSGANNLANQIKPINDLNVFPVPDGDTGTNMSKTFSAAAEAAILLESGNAGDILNALASASLRGARGNSGVILSQVIRGIAKACENCAEVDVASVMESAVQSAQTAYRAVMKPTEGTILTVVREMGEFAQENYENYEDVELFFKDIILAGLRSLENTPNLLPQLKQAGVVDAGGMGLMVILQGALYGLQNQKPIEILDTKFELYAQTEIKSEPSVDIKFIYCTEFIINKFKNRHANQFQAAIENKGDSVLVIEDDEIVKVHIHTNVPGFVMQQAVKLGELTNIKIDNMKYQHSEILNASEEQRTEKERETDLSNLKLKKFGFVAVAAGEGLAGLFADMQVDVVVEGGQTMNPSTQDILDAVEKVEAETIFILPNNKNIILSAQQVEGLTEKQIVVIPSKSVPQGFTALFAFSGENDTDTNKEAMIEAMGRIKSGQVTYAARDSVIDDKEISEGDIMGLSDGDVKIVGSNCAEVCKDLIEMLTDEDSSIISVYYGKDVSEEEANALKDEIEGKYSLCDFLFYRGNQEIYYYIVSVE